MAKILNPYCEKKQDLIRQLDKFSFDCDEDRSPKNLDKYDKIKAQYIEVDRLSREWTKERILELQNDTFKKLDVVNSLTFFEKNNKESLKELKRQYEEIRLYTRDILHGYYKGTKLKKLIRDMIAEIKANNKNPKVEKNTSKVEIKAKNKSTKVEKNINKADIKGSKQKTKLK